MECMWNACKLSNLKGASGHYTNAVSLGVTVETNGPEHIDRILVALREAGFQPKRIY